MKLEDLAVGQKYPVDTMIEGPFRVPVFPPEGPCYWIEFCGPLPIAVLAGGDDQSRCGEEVADE